MVLASFALRDHGNDGAEMTRSEAPKVEVGELVAIVLDCEAEVVGHAAVRGHIEQDRTGVADQPE